MFTQTRHLQARKEVAVIRDQNGQTVPVPEPAQEAEAAPAADDAPAEGAADAAGDEEAAAWRVKEEHAATKVQASFRGFKARQRVMEMQKAGKEVPAELVVEAEKEEAAEEEAAVEHAIEAAAASGMTEEEAAKKVGNCFSSDDTGVGLSTQRKLALKGSRDSKGVGRRSSYSRLLLHCLTAQVQASFRGFQARRRVAELKKAGKEVPADLQAQAEEEAAAIKVCRVRLRLLKVQRCCRGFKRLVCW